jgi:hypothetical protein
VSRTWERKVRKNSAQLNKARKKQGLKAMTPAADQAERFVGRNYIGPALIVMLTVFYAILGQANTAMQEDGTFYWLVIVMYLLLAVLFFFRRPYLAVGKDYVQTRKWTGDKRLQASDIRSIRVQPGYVVIEHKKGNWVFSRVMNRYPTDEMAARLSTFAQQHKIEMKQL